MNTMGKLLLCRVCLAKDVPMRRVVNTNLHQLYEALTQIPFESKGRRPVKVCYACYARLQECYLLRQSCLRSEGLLTEAQSNP